jgi:hypothetical protein
MDNYRRELRQAGLVLIVIGVADIGFMIYCVMTQRNYQSSLNIFAVIAGIFLVRGSLAAARVVTWFCAFLLAGFLGALLILFPTMQPLDLWLTQFRLDPMAAISIWGLTFAVLCALAWVYWRLRSPAVVRARVDAGLSSSPPRSAFVLGISLVVVLALLMHFTMGGENEAKAIDIAKSRYGPEYKYHVTGMRWSNSTVHATIAAYNDREVKSVEVQWER